MFDGSRLYFANDTAVLALAPYWTLARWRSEGRGPRYIKIGARVAYRGSDLNDWLATRTVEPTDVRARDESE